MTITEKISSLGNILRSSVLRNEDHRGHSSGADDWRLEIKYPLTDIDETAVRSQLENNAAGFISPYPPRRVNSIYFDAVDQFAVRANLDGMGDRTKIRLRWYGDSSEITDPVLEIKIKSRGAGSKLREFVDLGQNSTALSWRDIHQLLAEKTNPTIRYYLDAARQAMTFVSYSREYYESFDHKVRATIDTDIRYADQRISVKPRLEFTIPARRTTVVELKAPVIDERRLRELSNSLGWRAGRHSKYTNGVLRQIG
jgi:hypothetical protein